MTRVRKVAENTTLTRPPFRLGRPSPSRLAEEGASPRIAVQGEAGEGEAA